MDIDIDLAAPEAVYEQIVRQIEQGVQQGMLLPGAPLPSIRQVADDLALNPNTVAKAYKLLENQHVIVTAGRKGTFVSPDAAGQIDSRNRREAAYLAGQLLRDLLDKGLSATEIRAVFADVMTASLGAEGS